MSLEKQLLDVEKRLWRNDAELYRDNLVDEALLVFPEAGVLTRDVAVDAILAENADGRRWAEVDFEGVRRVQLTEDVALLYVKREGACKLALHQQSPLGAG